MLVHVDMLSGSTAVVCPSTLSNTYVNDFSIAVLWLDCGMLSQSASGDWMNELCSASVSGSDQ